MSADDAVVFHNVSFRFDSASEALFDDLAVHFSRGFTGVVGVVVQAKSDFRGKRSSETMA
jgi:hypothetical protein